VSLEPYLLAEGERKARLLRGLSKYLILNGQVTDGQVVMGYKSLHGTRPIFDGESRSVWRVSRRSTRIVLRVKETRDGCALGARDPKIARTEGRKCEPLPQPKQKKQEPKAHPVSRITLNCKPYEYRAPKG
jgi:hypothetical protein